MIFRNEPKTRTACWPIFVFLFGPFPKSTTQTPIPEQKRNVGFGLIPERSLSVSAACSVPELDGKPTGVGNVCLFSLGPPSNVSDNLPRVLPLHTFFDPRDFARCRLRSGFSEAVMSKYNDVIPLKTWCAAESTRQRCSSLLLTWRRSWGRRLCFPREHSSQNTPFSEAPSTTLCLWLPSATVGTQIKRTWFSRRWCTHSASRSRRAISEEKKEGVSRTQDWHCSGAGSACTSRQVHRMIKAVLTRVCPLSMCCTRTPKLWSFCARRLIGHWVTCTVFGRTSSGPFRSS